MLKTNQKAGFQVILLGNYNKYEKLIYHELNKKLWCFTNMLQFAVHEFMIVVVFGKETR
jgi:hypothetical protein